MPPGRAKLATSPLSTYAALQLWIDSWRWAGVPFFVRAGKSLKQTMTEIFIELNNPPQVVFKEAAPHMGNYVRFRLSPEVQIAIGARAKKAGEGMVGEPIELSVLDTAAQGSGGRMEAYERLLGDAMLGDATLFARQDVVEAAWAIVDPVHSWPQPDVRVRARHVGAAGSRQACRGRGRLEYAVGHEHPSSRF